MVRRKVRSNRLGDNLAGPSRAGHETSIAGQYCNLLLPTDCAECQCKRLSLVRGDIVLIGLLTATILPTAEPMVCMTLRWKGMDSNFESLSEIVPLAPAHAGESRADARKILLVSRDGCDGARTPARDHRPRSALDRLRHDRDLHEPSGRRPAGAIGGYTTAICRRSSPVNRFFGIIACTPRTMSTTCVTRKLTAMLQSA